MQEIVCAADAAARRYHRYPNVVGIAAGTKYVKGVPLDRLCVQFFVTRKTSAARPGLPAFVFARRRDGRVNRKLRFPTDVIEVGHPQLACTAGSPVEGVGSRATLTLLFGDRMSPRRVRYLLLTCAHVAGDLTESPPTERWLTSPAHPKVPRFAEVVKCGTRHGNIVEYDVALAELTAGAVAAIGASALDRMEGRIAATSTRMEAFLPAAEIRPPLSVECHCAESKTRSGHVRSLPGTVLVRVSGREVWVRNACLMDVTVRAGDSGGLVYAGSSAVGIVFARSPRGAGWFHPLEPAVAFLESVEPRFALRCFSWNEHRARRNV